jgi:hypothetical protein
VSKVPIARMRLVCVGKLLKDTDPLSVYGKIKRKIKLIEEDIFLLKKNI